VEQLTESAVAVVERYFAAWNEQDRARRRALLADAWTEDAVYVDPMFAAAGHAELDDMIAALHQQFPGHRFRKVGAVQAHHDRARWAWELADPAGAAAAAGVDFAVLAPDGRLAQVTGFLDAQPGPA
jgi:hypothetical protein